MYHVDDVVVYGGYGVCKVIETGIRNVAGSPVEKDYYAISPIDEKSTLYIPAEGTKVPLRSPMNVSEANALIAEIASIAPMPLGAYREREKTYRNVVKNVDCRELVALLKAILILRRNNPAKRPSYADERYYRLSESILCGELTYLTDIPKNQIMQEISDSI